MPSRGMELHEELFLFAFGVARPFADAGDIFEVDRFDAVLVFKDNAAGGHFFHRAFYDGIRPDDRIDKTFFSDKLFCQFFHDALLLVLLFSVQMMSDCRDFQSLLPQDDKDDDENRNQPTQVLHFFSVTPPARQPVPLFNRYHLIVYTIRPVLSRGDGKIFGGINLLQSAAVAPDLRAGCDLK